MLGCSPATLMVLELKGECSCCDQCQDDPAVCTNDEAGSMLGKNALTVEGPTALKLWIKCAAANILQNNKLEYKQLHGACFTDVDRLVVCLFCYAARDWPCLVRQVNT